MIVCTFVLNFLYNCNLKPVKSPHYIPDDPDPQRIYVPELKHFIEYWLDLIRETGFSMLFQIHLFS